MEKLDLVRYAEVYQIPLTDADITRYVAATKQFKNKHLFATHTYFDKAEDFANACCLFNEHKLTRIRSTMSVDIPVFTLNPITFGAVINMETSFPKRKCTKIVTPAFFDETQPQIVLVHTSEYNSDKGESETLSFILYGKKKANNYFYTEKEANALMGIEGGTTDV